MSAWTDESSVTWRLLWCWYSCHEIPGKVGRSPLMWWRSQVNNKLLLHPFLLSAYFFWLIFKTLASSLLPLLIQLKKYCASDRDSHRYMICLRPANNVITEVCDTVLFPRQPRELKGQQNLQTAECAVYSHSSITWGKHFKIFLIRVVVSYHPCFSEKGRRKARVS